MIANDKIMKYQKKYFKFLKGKVYHNRYGKIEHYFKNRIIAIIVDLTSISEERNLKKPFLFSINKLNFFSWMPSDHGSRTKNSKPKELLNFIFNLIKKKSYQSENIKSIKLMCFPRVLGFGFNPLSIYFCYDGKDNLVHTIFEVKNTFGDIHHYVLLDVNKKGNSQKVLKKLFVSPFYSDNGCYELSANYLNKKLRTTVKYKINNEIIFTASMKLEEIEFNNYNFLVGLINFLFFPGKIWLNIHLQALKIWLKKVSLNKIPKSKKVKYSIAQELTENKK